MSISGAMEAGVPKFVEEFDTQETNSSLFLAPDGSGGLTWASPPPGVTDHGALTGLSDDDHTQYLHLTTARIITAVHTFNPTTAGAPFTIGANALGQLVSGLNADMLDGYEATAFSFSGHTHDHTTLTSIGTNTHADIDAHIASTSNPHNVTLAQVGGTTDHGSLVGLADDDHPQYLTQARGDALYSPLAHSHALDDLSDVSVSGAVSGQHLSFDGTSWVPETPSPGVTDHGALTGLADDDHTQYVHNSSARTITAVHTFDPSAAGPAFTLGLNATGQLITGLNADQLDGYEASAFSLSGHTHDHTTLTNIGVNTHADIDTHIASTSNPHNVTLAQVGGTTDHGSLGGLTDDDHTQYLLADGSRIGSTSQAQDFGSTGIKTDVVVASTSGANIKVKSDLLTDKWLSVVYNTALGVSVFGAGNLAHTLGSEGWYNTAIGNKAMYTNSLGALNTAVGYSALYFNLTGGSNVAIGYTSLYNNSSGGYNVAVGRNSLYSNTSASYNTGVGNGTLAGITTGGYNTAIGRNAGRYIADGVTGNETTEYSVFIGYGTKASADGVTNEIVIGYDATGMGSNTVVVGNDNITDTYLKGTVHTGLSTDASSSHVFHASGGDGTLTWDGSYFKVDNDWFSDRWLNSETNTAYGIGVFGAGALSSTTAPEGMYNLAFGYYSLYSNSTGYDNVGLGSRTLYNNTTGIRNLALGAFTLYNNTTGTNNTAFGYAALYSLTTGSSNVAAGGLALRNLQTSAHNIAVGYSAAYNILYSYNVAIGGYALYSASTVKFNVGVGNQSLSRITTGWGNIGIGADAGRYIADGVTGNETTEYSVFIGYGTKASADGVTNEIVIGYNATGKGSNTATIGNDSVTDTYLKGKVHSVNGFIPPTLADVDAPNNSIYYSSTQSKLVYKDSAGTVNLLY